MPMTRAVRAGLFARAVEVLGEGAVEDVGDQGGFAGAGDAGDDGHDAEREVRGDVLEVVRGGVFDGDPLAGERARAAGRATISILPARYWPVSEAGLSMTVLRRAVGDEVAAVLAGAGAEVEDVVGVADGVFVVLDDEDGVAEVAEVFERVSRRWLSRWWRPMEGSSRT